MIITMEDLNYEYCRIMNEENKINHTKDIPDSTEIYKIVFGSKITEKMAKAYFKFIEEGGCKNCNSFTAIIVMSTLLSQGRWYDWREKEYH